MSSNGAPEGARTTNPGEAQPEPWLRGPLPDVSAAVMPVFFCFAQVREDLARHTSGLHAEVLWKQTSGGSLGFQLKHIAGSVDRLTTYLMGGQLSAEQHKELAREQEPDGGLTELLTYLDQRLTQSEVRIFQLDPKQLFETRAVGRRALPTTVIGLLVHLCEHTQRHVGQAITLAKMLK